MLVLVLHAVIIAALLEVTLATRERPQEAEAVVSLEQILNLKPGSPRSEPSRRAAGSRAITPPPVAFPVFEQPDVSGLGNTLFNCTPEKLDMLSQEQRTRCRLALGGPPGNRWTAFKPPPSEVQYAELWQKAIEDRNTPTEVPCVAAGGGRVALKTPDRQPINGPPASQKPGIGVSYVCIALMLWRELNR